LVIALIFFVFNVVLALSLATDSVINSVGEKIDISAEILPEVESYSIQTLISSLRKRPEVKEVIYVSNEEALKNFSIKYPNVVAFLEDNTLENPLPHVIRVISNNLADNNLIIAFLEQPQFSRLIHQEKLVKNQEQKTRNERILDITQFIHQVGWWLIAIFALVTVLILFNSINLNIHSHKQEIGIMRLVGARHGFIKNGFLFEGVLYAVIALLLSLLFSKIVVGTLTRNRLIVREDRAVLSGLNAILLHFEDRFWLTLLWQLGIAIGLGLLSSWLAIRLYLREQFFFNE
jgi:cell division transport system permease protein